MKDPHPIDPSGIIHVPEKPGLGIEFNWNASDTTCAGHDVRKV